MIKYFDIFAGIGGFRSGLEKAGGFECVGYCEIDRYAKKAYETMYDTEGEVYYDDARKINPNELPDFDLICGGFPCQSFSIAGKRGGFDDARGTLFFEIARIAAVKKPKYLLLENVPGLLSHNCLSFARRAGRLRPSSVRWMIALALHGRYDVVWEVLNSADFSRAELRQCPNPEKECILSDFIEKSVPEKYCLSRTQIQKLLSKEFQAERETGYIQQTD